MDGDTRQATEGTGGWRYRFIRQPAKALSTLQSSPLGLLLAALTLTGVSLSGSVVHQLFFEACGIMAVSCVAVGVRRHHPQHPEVWLGLASCISIFVVSFGIRLAVPTSVAAMSPGTPRLPDYLDMVGLTFVAATLFQQSRIRDDACDPTNTLDSLLVAGGVSAVIWLLRVYPALNSGSLATTTKFVAIYMGVQLTWLAFGAARLAMTFRARNGATLRLVLAILLGVVAGLCAVDARNATNHAMTLFAGTALLLLGSAALHSSMTELTATGNRDPKWIPAGRASAVRATIAGPALLVAPSILLVESGFGGLNALNTTYLLLLQIVLTGLVILRLVNLMKLRQWSGDVDRIGLTAASSLAGSPTTSDTYSIATTTMIELLPSNPHTTAALVIAEDDVWTIVESAGNSCDKFRETVLPSELMHEALDAKQGADQQLGRLLRPDLRRHAIVLVIPLLSQRVLRGALISVTTEPASVVVRSALGSLAMGVTLSLEAISFDVGGRDVDALLAVIRPEDQPALAEILKRARGHDRRERIDMRAFRIGSGSAVRWFSLNYQPIFKTENLELVGFEAFLRWVHPTLGLLPPGSFIPLAEQNGSIDEIGKWVLVKACEQLAEWGNVYGCDAFISVNVSPVQLQSDSIVAYVRSALNDWRISPDRLVLELTGSNGLDDPDQRRRVKQLGEMGCKIVADNFGTGFESYDILRQLPFSGVKVDSGLLSAALLNDEDSEAKVKSITEMARWLGLTITSKGVEDFVHLDGLLGRSASYAEGFLLGAPLPAMYAAESYLEGPLNSHI